MSDYSVPGTHPVSIDGRGYLVDLTSDQFAYETIPLLNPQLQQSAEQVSESSLNPEGLWRRSQASWHKGAGQTYLDKPDSDAARFRSSLGIDVWESGQISLLNDVTKIFSIPSGKTGARLVMARTLTGIWVGVDDALYKISSPYTGSSTSVGIHLAEGAQQVYSVIPYGLGVFVALGPNGIHSVDPALTVTHYNDVTCDRIAMVAGRLMASYQNKVYNVTASGAAPAALYTHPDSFFFFNGFAEAKGYIYISGASIISDFSYIYKTTIKPDGTALDIPSVATPLPEGEKVTAIYGYLNFILIGTTKGVRLAVPDSNGNLEVGALIDIERNVIAFEGQESFIWFGWANYDGTHTGLGRLDLRTLVGGVAPAYASDIMAGVQGSISAVLTDSDGKRVFAVLSQGLYKESTYKVSTGTIDSGFITYDLPEEKEARFIDVRYQDLEGTDAIYLANQDLSFTLVRTNTEADLEKRFSAGDLVGDMHEIRHVFTRDSTDNTLGPILTRHTLKSQVKVDMGAYWYIPLLLAINESDQSGNERYRDIVNEWEYLIGLAGQKETVELKILNQVYSVSVEDVRFVPSNQDQTGIWYNGTMIAKLKVAV